MKIELLEPTASAKSTVLPQTPFGNPAIRSIFRATPIYPLTGLHQRIKNGERKSQIHRAMRGDVDDHFLIIRMVKKVKFLNRSETVF